MRFSRTRLSDALHARACAECQPAFVGSSPLPPGGLLHPSGAVSRRAGSAGFAAQAAATSSEEFGEKDPTAGRRRPRCCGSGPRIHISASDPEQSERGPGIRSAWTGQAETGRSGEWEGREVIASRDAGSGSPRWPGQLRARSRRLVALVAWGRKHPFGCLGVGNLYSDPDR